MIHIKQVYKEITKESKARLIADLKLHNKSLKLWYEVSLEYEKYIVVDRADPFIIAFINYAMLNNLDIVSDVPISQSIYYKLKTHYIPALHNNNKDFYNIELKTQYMKDIEENYGAVATGMSAGIDSFTTLFLNTQDDIPHQRKITHLAFFNVGAVQSSNTGRFDYDEILKYEDEKIIKRSLEINELRYNRALKIANQLDLPLVRVESNIMEIQKMKHKFLHVQRAVSAVFVLQKLFSGYYFASTFSLNDFVVDTKDPSHYDVFSLAMFSTKNLEFLSGDSAYNRVEKTNLIKNERIVQNNLNVCWREDENCGECDKCLRTLVTLDFLGALDLFKHSFDIDKYKRKRNRNIAYVKVSSLTNPYFKQIIQLAKNQNIKYLNFQTISFYVPIFIKKYVRKALTNPQKAVKRVLKRK